MPIFTIPKGWHRHKVPPFLFLPWAGKQSIKRRVTFGEGCIYDSPEYNAEDVNKLFGITFGVVPRQIEVLEEIPDGNVRDVSQIRYRKVKKWVGPGHWNSARFGWVWSPKYQCWKLLNYCYVNGKKNWDEQLRYREIARVPRAVTVDLCLDYYPRTGQVHFQAFLYLNEHEHVLMGQDWAQLPPNLPTYGLQMGFYFGGQLVTPHRMQAKIDPF